jgi:hypothetical protein
MKIARLQKYDCDRCGFTYKKHQLRRQRGQLLCSSCRDDIRDILAPRPRFFSPRDNSTSVEPVTEPTVFSISAGTGINFLANSREFSQEGGRDTYYMEVIGDGGPIDIVSNPQIVDGQHGDILTLRGNSDINTITLEDSGELHLNGNWGNKITLGDGDTITFVYNEPGTYLRGWGYFYWGNGQGYSTESDGWVECSRYKGGL